METFFSRWQPGEITALASVLTALAALLVSPLISYVISKRQAITSIRVVEKQISASAEIASAQIEASSISTKRQEWINTLRSELTTVLALGAEIRRQRDAFQDIHFKFVNAFSKIELLVNPLEDDHIKLIMAIDSYYRAIIATDTMLDWKANEANYRRLLVFLAQLVLKKEWTVIRFGAPDEDRLRGLRGEISLLRDDIAAVKSRFDK